jgi:hypothetical protein
MRAKWTSQWFGMQVTEAVAISQGNASLRGSSRAPMHGNKSL